MGSAAVQTTGLLSQEAGISEDADATLNSDTPQLGNQQCRQAEWSAPMSPLETTSYHLPFLRGGTGERKGLVPGQGAGWCGARTKSWSRWPATFLRPGPAGQGQGMSSGRGSAWGHGGTRVRHPKLDNLVGHKRGPPAARSPARTDTATEGPRPPPRVATGRDCPGHLHQLEDMVRLPVLEHFRGDAVRGRGRVHAMARFASPW